MEVQCLLNCFRLRCYFRFQFHLLFFLHSLRISFVRSFARSILICSETSGKTTTEINFQDEFSFEFRCCALFPKNYIRIHMVRCVLFVAYYLLVCLYFVNKCSVAGAFILTSGSVIIMSLLPIVYSFIVVAVLLYVHSSYHMFNYILAKNWTRLDRFKIKRCLQNTLHGDWMGNESEGEKNGQKWAKWRRRRRKRTQSTWVFAIKRSEQEHLVHWPNIWTTATAAAPVLVATAVKHILLFISEGFVLCQEQQKNENRLKSTKSALNWIENYRKRNECDIHSNLCCLSFLDAFRRCMCVCVMVVGRTRRASMYSEWVSG